MGDIGRGTSTQLTRLAASDADKMARDRLVEWLRNAGLDVVIDRIGNIFGIWQVKSDLGPLMMGSHIDTVINAGIFDGSLGVLSALSTIEACQKAGATPDRSMIVAAFTNEEGVRFAPDMMGSLVYSGGLAVDEALEIVGIDGAVLGDELARIGYSGSIEPGSIVPSAFLELHVEQGPVMESEGVRIGAVIDLQGISWQKILISGNANHAGTTPIRLRNDAGLAAAKTNIFLRDYVSESQTVATVGTLRFEPNAINVIPAKAEFTVDLRDPDELSLCQAEADLAAFLSELETRDGVNIEAEQLARFQPVQFDERLVTLIEQGAAIRGLSCRRMTSGAGHDAQMMSRICPAAMIFVPSRDGVSHCPLEHTNDTDLVAGAQVLLDTARQITGLL